MRPRPSLWLPRRPDHHRKNPPGPAPTPHSEWAMPAGSTGQADDEQAAGSHEPRAARGPHGPRHGPQSGRARHSGGAPAATQTLHGGPQLAGWPTAAGRSPRLQRWLRGSVQMQTWKEAEPSWHPTQVRSQRSSRLPRPAPALRAQPQRAGWPRAGGGRAWRQPQDGERRTETQREAALHPGARPHARQGALGAQKRRQCGVHD